MPTVAELERLEALVGRLTPLTDIQRGELIRAQDWNTVVGALIEALRAVLAESQDGFVEAHEHPDQVTSGWLDPRLRALIERGPLVDPAGIARLAEIERRMQRQIDQLEGVLAEQESTRARLSDLTTRDQTRQANLTQLQRTVEAMVDARQEVLDLRATLSQLQADVVLAVEASHRFVINGEPVDMEALDARLRSLEELRGRLTNPDGSLLDAQALEIRLTDLTNTLVTQAALDEAIKSVRPELTEQDRAEIEQNVRVGLTTDIDTAVTGLRSEIQAASADTLAQLDQKLSDALASAIPGIRDSLLEQIRPEIAQAVQGSQAEIEKLLAVRMNDLRQEFNKALEELKSDLSNFIAEEIKRQLGDSTGSIVAHLVKIDSRLEEHDRAISELRRRLGSVPPGVTPPAAPEDLAPVEERLRQELEQTVAAGIKSEIEKLNRRLPRLIKKQLDERSGPG